MLILTRKIDQSIIIQGNITVMVLGVERDRVKLGIAAPDDVTVLREELVDAENAPQPLRPRLVARSAPAAVGNLALKPQPKRR
ncbi:MAG TPA: carbon storage regulator [Dehalococcoidia bacterium]|jgi:carbon storage regulator CsrA|nr:carbon storage regulator [Dehalococcoidia bacterium]